MAFEYPDRLKEIQEQIKNGVKPQPVTARAFIGWFGAQRRTFWNVLSIRRALAEYKLVTKPDFEGVYIDAHVSIEQAPQKPGKSPTVAEPDADPTYRIGKLASANRPLVSVKPDALVSEAVTLMLSYDYSQLPVMTNEREVKGMVSWLSVGRRLALEKPCNHVRDCMAPHHVISADTGIFAAIDGIVQHQYALIRDAENVISGIVTTTDLSIQFRQLGEPFLLLGEIENYIRRMIQGKYSIEELTEACDPSDKDRDIQVPSDLTFGEYVRLLENPDRWAKLKLAIDRGVFVTQLDEIRQIRNDVMHFDPDGPVDADIDKLRRFVKLMQGLAEIGAI